MKLQSACWNQLMGRGGDPDIVNKNMRKRDLMLDLSVPGQAGAGVRLVVWFFFPSLVYPLRD